jgi:hypothetical protein
MEILLSFAGCLVVLIVIVGVILLAVWILRSNAQDAKKYNQQREEKAAVLHKNGITSPATIRSARNGIVKGSKNNQRMLVTFDVEVQPEGRAAFQTTFQDWIGISQHTTFVAGSERTKDAGRTIWVTYDPNDVSQIMFEYYNENRKYMLGRPIFERMEKTNKTIRETGEKASAIILEAEDMELANVVEKDHLQQTIMRLKLDVTPQNGESYKAETQALFANSSLGKYTAGKKVYVKFNPQDKTQVALIGSAEE